MYGVCKRKIKIEETYGNTVTEVDAFQAEAQNLTRNFCGLISVGCAQDWTSDVILSKCFNSRL